MGLVGHLEGDRACVVAGDARQRFHDARGYGGAPGSAQKIQLDPVEAAHLLFRRRSQAIRRRGRAARISGADSSPARPRSGLRNPRSIVYADLRPRGFDLVPARSALARRQTQRPTTSSSPGGPAPPSDPSSTSSTFSGERPARPNGVAAASASSPIVDEELEVTYFQIADEGPDGLESADTDFPQWEAVEAELLADRVILWDAPPALYDELFFGQPLEGREGDRTALQCSLLEGAYLADRGVVSLDSAHRIRERGRTLEGDRFDTRLAVYRHLRDHGVVAKTGYKFGADFRTYPTVMGVDELGHSSHLVRVQTPDAVYDHRDLSLDVRLAQASGRRWFSHWSMRTASPGDHSSD
ncbi:MAG: tRNA-intron lyase [Natrialbaceae archaeon]|nr:tRNA-intron lyase [Natrialbaceae archaeon]